MGNETLQDISLLCCTSMCCTSFLLVGVASIAWGRLRRSYENFGKGGIFDDLLGLDNIRDLFGGGR